MLASLRARSRSLLPSSQLQLRARHPPLMMMTRDRTQDMSALLLLSPPLLLVLQLRLPRLRRLLTLAPLTQRYWRSCSSSSQSLCKDKRRWPQQLVSWVQHIRRLCFRSTSPHLSLLSRLACLLFRSNSCSLLRSRRHLSSRLSRRSQATHRRSLFSQRTLSLHLPALALLPDSHREGCQLSSTHQRTTLLPLLRCHTEASLRPTSLLLSRSRANGQLARVMLLTIEWATSAAARATPAQLASRLFTRLSSTPTMWSTSRRPPCRRRQFRSCSTSLSQDLCLNNFNLNQATCHRHPLGTQFSRNHRTNSDQRRFARCWPITIHTPTAVCLCLASQSEQRTLPSLWTSAQTCIRWRKCQVWQATLLLMNPLSTRPTTTSLPEHPVQRLDVSQLLNPWTLWSASYIRRHLAMASATLDLCLNVILITIKLSKSSTTRSLSSCSPSGILAIPSLKSCRWSLCLLLQLCLLCLVRFLMSLFLWIICWECKRCADANLTRSGSVLAQRDRRKHVSQQPAVIIQSTVPRLLSLCQRVDANGSQLAPYWSEKQSCRRQRNVPPHVHRNVVPTATEHQQQLQLQQQQP